MFSENVNKKDESFYKLGVQLCGKNLQSVIWKLNDEKRAARINFENMMKDSQLCKAAKIFYVCETAAKGTLQSILLSVCIIFEEENVLLRDERSGDFPTHFTNILIKALTETFKDAELVFPGWEMDNIYKCITSVLYFIKGQNIILRPRAAKICLRETITKNVLDFSITKMLNYYIPDTLDLYINVLDVLSTNYGKGYSELFVPEQDIIALYEETIEVMKNEKEKLERMLDFGEVFDQKTGFSTLVAKRMFGIVLDVLVLCDNLDGLFDENSVLAKELEEELIKCKAFKKASFEFIPPGPQAMGYKFISALGAKQLIINAIVEAPTENMAYKRTLFYKFDIRNAFKKVLGAIVLKL